MQRACSCGSVDRQTDRQTDRHTKHIHRQTHRRRRPQRQTDRHTKHIHRQTHRRRRPQYLRSLSDAVKVITLVVVSRFRWHCTVKMMSVLWSVMTAKVTAETEVWGTDSATMRTDGSSNMSATSTVAGSLLRCRCKSLQCGTLLHVEFNNSLSATRRLGM